MTVASWLAQERAEYADLKYRRDGDKWHEWMVDLSLGLRPTGLWVEALDAHLKRAQECGIDTPAGMQAFGKFVVTALSCFEAAVIVNGKPPMPGVATGNIEPWMVGPSGGTHVDG